VILGRLRHILSRPQHLEREAGYDTRAASPPPDRYGDLVVYLSELIRRRTIPLESVVFVAGRACDLTALNCGALGWVDGETSSRP
jgi:hypothetical protein